MIPTTRAAEKGLDSGDTVIVTAIDRAGMINVPQGTVGLTAGHVPNLLVQTITPLASILVRSLRVFLQTMVGLMSAGAVVPSALPAEDFYHLLVKCAGLSVAAAAMCALQNIVELLSRLDQKFPLWRG